MRRLYFHILYFSEDGTEKAEYGEEERRRKREMGRRRKREMGRRRRRRGRKSRKEVRKQPENFSKKL